ncbi:MAG: hypothetical protein ACQEXJ_12135 [Myxococcota bacterium]
MTLESLAAMTAWWSAVTALLAGALTLRYVPRASRSVSRWEWAALAAVVATAMVLGWLVPGYQRIYTDEAYYMLVGSELLANGGVAEGTGYAKAFGWPALLGVAFALGPRDPATAITATNLLGIATPVLIFAAAGVWAGPRGRRIGLVAALLLATSPTHTLLSNTAEANVAGMFSVSLLLLAGGLWWKRPNTHHALFLFASAALSASTRPEATVPLVVLAVAAAVHPDRRRMLWLLAGGLVWASPNLWRYASLHLGETARRIEEFGQTAAMAYPWTHFVTGNGQPILAALAGLGLLLGSRAARGPTLALGAWLFGTLALLSVAGAGALALPERFVLAPDVPAALLAGLAVSTLSARLHEYRAWAPRVFVIALVAGVLALGLSGHRRHLRAHPGYALQHRLPERIEEVMPRGCKLVATRPEIYQATTDLEVLSAQAVLDGDAATGACAAFVWDLTCFEWEQPPFARQCAVLRDLAVSDPMAVFSPPGPPDPHHPREAMLLALPRLPSPAAPPGATGPSRAGDPR